MSIKGGPYHEIFYVDNVDLIDEGPKFIEWNEEDYVEIHDDILSRFHDYFMWIETYNPVGPKEFNRGFNYEGLTAIRDENLVKFGELIDSLLNLFKNAPDDIILTGGFCWGTPPDIEVPIGYNLNNGYYEKIKIEKDELLKIFGDLKKITARAVESNGYLLHFGL